MVPGEWSAADFRFQAEHIVTSKMNNSGHNCIASQVLVLPRDWGGTERLLEEIRQVLCALPTRSDYYPGAEQRLDAVLKAHPDAESYADGCRLLVPDIADHDDVLLTREVFASALGVVRLPGDTAAAFLRNAVDFANDKVPGTLGATMMVHPRTEKDHRAATERAVAELRYGTLGITCSSAIGFLLGYTPWGACPGHTRQQIGSGIGFVNNVFMLEDIEKTLVRAPFAPAPAGCSPAPLPCRCARRTSSPAVPAAQPSNVSPASPPHPASPGCPRSSPPPSVADQEPSCWWGKPHLSRLDGRCTASDALRERAVAAVLAARARLPQSCQSSRTPGLRMRWGSRASLTACSARAKGSGRWRS
ncbi:hypothetical protein [Streptomyces sp. NPDC060035]|uniref:hypothetical protein n=1 Tax=Streptomyces sp. NPDC060035 TaxID=3347044 RepID=UPI003691105C